MFHICSHAAYQQQILGIAGCYMPALLAVPSMPVNLPNHCVRQRHWSLRQPDRSRVVPDLASRRSCAMAGKRDQHTTHRAPGCVRQALLVLPLLLVPVPEHLNTRVEVLQSVYQHTSSRQGGAGSYRACHLLCWCGEGDEGLCQAR